MRRVGPLLMSTVLIAGCAGMAAKNESIRTLLEKSGQSQAKLSDYEQGKRHLTLGNAGLAVEAFQRALKAQPGSVEAMNGLAVAYDRLGRPDVAQRFLDEALNLDPNSTVTLNNLAYLNLTQGNTAVAQAYSERAKIAASLPMEMMLPDTIASAINRNIDIVNQVAKNEAKPRDAAEIANLPPERAVKRVGLNEWELKIGPPQGGEPVKVNLPRMDSIPAVTPAAPPQMSEPAMSSLLVPAPAADFSVSPAPKPEAPAKAAPQPQMTESAIAALVEPPVQSQPIAPPVEPFIAAPVETAPSEEPPVVAATKLQQMLNELTAPPVTQDLAPMPVPEIVTPEIVTTKAAPPPSPLTSDAVIASLGAAKPVIAPLAQRDMIVPALPAPQLLAPAATPDPLTSAEVIASLDAAKPVVVPLPQRQVTPPALLAPQALEPATTPDPLASAEVIASLGAAKPAIAPLPQRDVAAPALPTPQPLEPALTPASEATQTPEPTPAEIVVASLPPVPAIEAAPAAASALQIVEPAPAPIIAAPQEIIAPRVVEPVAPANPQTVVASVLAPPVKPDVLSVPKTSKPQLASATVPAPVPATPNLPGNVIAAPSSSLTNIGPDLTWKAYVPAGTLVRVSNGTGRSRMAARFAAYFGEHGMSIRRIANANSFNYRRTTIFYNPDQQEFAYRLANILPFGVQVVEASKGHGEIELILGSDLLDLDDTLRKS